MTVLILIEDLYEDLELWYPKIRLEEAGYKTLIAGPEKGVTYHGKKGNYPCVSEETVKNLHAKDFQGLVIPGGFAPDRMRRCPDMVRITKEFDEQKKMIAFICHAGWLPISANILKGKKVTGFFSIKDDLTNAGAHYEDREVLVDGHLISSRTPDDLPAFGKAMIHFLGKK